MNKSVISFCACIALVLCLASMADASWIGRPYWTGDMTAASSSNLSAAYTALNVVDDWQATPSRNAFVYAGGGYDLRTDVHGSWHSANNATLRTSPSGVTTREWLAFDFGAAFDLYSIDFWNLNYADAAVRAARSPKDISIDVTTDGVTWTRVWDGQLAMAPGTLTEPLPEPRDQPNNQFNLPYGASHQTSAMLNGPVSAQIVVINLLNQWGGTGTGYYALDEVRFYTPEPATMVLLGLGITVLLRKQR